MKKSELLSMLSNPTQPQVRGITEKNMKKSEIVSMLATLAIALAMGLMVGVGL